LSITFALEVSRGANDREGGRWSKENFGGAAEEKRKTPQYEMFNIPFGGTALLLRVDRLRNE